MNVKEEFEKYKQARSNLSDMFDGMEMWWNIVDETKSDWYRDGHNFIYKSEDGDGWYSVHMYGQCVKNKDGYTLVVANNDSGDRDLYLFSDSKITDERDGWDYW